MPYHGHGDKPEAARAAGAARAAVPPGQRKPGPGPGPAMVCRIELARTSQNPVTESRPLSARSSASVARQPSLRLRRRGRAPSWAGPGPGPPGPRSVVLVRLPQVTRDLPVPVARAWKQPSGLDTARDAGRPPPESMPTPSQARRPGPDSATAAAAAGHIGPRPGAAAAWWKELPAPGERLMARIRLPDPGLGSRRGSRTGPGGARATDRHLDSWNPRISYVDIRYRSTGLRYFIRYCIHISYTMIRAMYTTIS